MHERFRDVSPKEEASATGRQPPAFDFCERNLVSSPAKSNPNGKTCGQKAHHLGRTTANRTSGRHGAPPAYGQSHVSGMDEEKKKQLHSLDGFFTCDVRT